MLREKLMSHHEPVDGFRWRNHEITRIEGFSDAVFGFAVTLLIVSLEVPRTSTELLATMRGFGAFLVTFFILVRLWYAQFTFFRRYALEDKTTVVLNLALLFTVLFFVYPLKFLFSTMMVDPFLRGAIRTGHGIEPIVLPQHRPLIFLIFGAGFAAVFGVFFLLYRHAYKQREKLQLNEFEIFETQHSVRRMGVATLIGVCYLPLGVVQTLPSKTPAQERVVILGSLAVLALFLGLLMTMARMARRRRHVHRQWKAQQAQGPDEPHEPLGSA